MKENAKLHKEHMQHMKRASTVSMKTPAPASAFSSDRGVTSPPIPASGMRLVLHISDLKENDKCLRKMVQFI